MALQIPKAAKAHELRDMAKRPGRDAFFTHPEQMWEAFIEYTAWVDKHPIKEKKLINDKLSHKLVNVPLSRPYTYAGFTLYLGVTESYFRQKRKEVKDRLYGNEGKDARPEDPAFETVLEQIDSTIYSQKLEGASVGIFNAMIIARDLKLKETTELTGKDGTPLQGGVINIHPVMAPSMEIKENDDEDDDAFKNLPQQPTTPQ